MQVLALVLHGVERAVAKRRGDLEPFADRHGVGRVRRAAARGTERVGGDRPSERVALPEPALGQGVGHHDRVAGAADGDRHRPRVRREADEAALRRRLPRADVEWQALKELPAERRLVIELRQRCDARVAQVFQFDRLIIRHPDSVAACRTCRLKRPQCTKAPAGRSRWGLRGCDRRRYAALTGIWRALLASVLGTLSVSSPSSNEADTASWSASRGSTKLRVYVAWRRSRTR